MKTCIASLIAMLVCSTFADTPVEVMQATGSWNSAWDNSDFYWYPDNGPNFEAKIYTHTIDGSGHRTYNNYFTKSYGSSDWAWNDSFNTYASLDPQGRSTTVLILMRYHYSSITYNNAWSDYPDGWPQSCMVFNVWHPGTYSWSTTQLYIPEPNYWCVWAVTYNAYWKICYAAMLNYGSTYTYPANVSAYEAAGN